MTFAAELKQARLAAGLTQAQTAKRLGVTSQTIYYWEAGKRTPPTARSLTQSDIISRIQEKT